MSKQSKRLTSRRRFLLWMILPGVLAVLTLTYYPLSRGIVMAFQHYTLWDIFDRRFIAFQNFIEIFRTPEFPTLLWNTARWVFVSLFFQFLLGFALALLLKRKFRGSGIYQGIVYVPWAISGSLIGLIWRWLMNGQSGALNDVLMRLNLIAQPIRWLSDINIVLWSCIIANVWYGVPFFAIMNLAALQSIPADVYEAADMDGCGAIRRFFSITMPYIKPTVIVTILLRTIWIFNSFDLIVVITGGGPANHSQTLPSFMYTRAFSGYDFGLASALGVLLMVILAVYAVVFLQGTKYNRAGDF
ncbi:MAG: sugar ABC transporter permease [Eubacteriales bacterium]|nr:sugar ABC transporter permease [Eubacteriales bacterium]